MNELSLFTGAGGGVLGSKLLGWRTIGYVEYEKYCQEIIKQRITDGILDPAPIFGDIRKFISEGYAESYRGMVDVLSAGFPCQPFSVAGKRVGENDPRNMWPQALKCIRLVRPKFAFLENVPGLLSIGYFGTIIGGLAQAGYNAKWCVLGADDIGANHRRKRLWIFAYPQRLEREAWAEWKWLQSKKQETIGQNPRNICEVLANPNKEGLQGSEETGNFFKNREEPNDQFVGGRNSSWWSIEPRVGRVASGVSFRVDRLKALGNAQVPLQMAYAFSILSQGIIK